MIKRKHVMAFLVVLVLAALAQSQTFTTLYSFTGGSDGGWPEAGVVQDTAGNLYGTTEEGGNLNCSAPYGCGVVYEVNSAGKETVLHAFSGYPDGTGPIAPVVRGKAGNIYGTTVYGGAGNCNFYGTEGCGTVFKIDKAGNETVLYRFAGGSDGCYPSQGLAMDRDENLYGTTAGCGSGYETIFKLDRAGNFTVLHTFTGSDGAAPEYGHLAMDKSGNLYGLTTQGGVSGYGTLYELSKNGTFMVLHTFAGGTSDGCNPYGSVVRDKAGNLYGTTYQCGSSGRGTIWKVSNRGKETVLYNFEGRADGCWPYAGVARDGKGNLYGVTVACGGNDGALYELNAKGSLIPLQGFDNSNGAFPFGEVLRSINGTLFGTTTDICASGSGTVWSYVP